MSKWGDDIYYLDYLNMVNDKINFDKKAGSNTSNTMRLYTTKSEGNDGLGNLEWLLLTAPYIQPVGILGVNQYEAGKTDLFSFLADKTVSGMNAGRESIRSLFRTGSKTVDFFKNIMKNGFGEVIQGNMSGSSVNPTEFTAPTDVRTDTPTEITKSYMSTKIELPVNEISATYLSNPANDWNKTGFGWLGNGKDDNGPLPTHIELRGEGNRKLEVKKLPQQPLKTMADYLCRILIGGISVNSSGTMIFYEAPNQYGSYAGIQTNYGRNALSLCIGNGTIITNLVPTQVSIQPSRYLTTTGDYYSLSVTVGLDISRYILSDELSEWIHDLGYGKGTPTESAAKVKMEESAKENIERLYKELEAKGGN